MMSRFAWVSLISMLLLSFSLGSVVLGNNLSVLSGSNNTEFSIIVDSNNGLNEYNLVEIDEGDNDEEKQITLILHEFNFSSIGGDNVNWDFGDGNTASGIQVIHHYDSPGVYLVTAMSISSSSVESDSLTVIVDLAANAEVDNMECECAPTAKDTIIDLVPVDGIISIEGFLTVEHDGSSESCSLRNPLQECHLRVIMQRTESGNIVMEEILFDETFRSNQKVVDFNLNDITFEQGEGIQLRLETDQLRDWHKPNANWLIEIEA